MFSGFRDDLIDDNAAKSALSYLTNTDPALAPSTALGSLMTGLKSGTGMKALLKSVAAGLTPALSAGLSAAQGAASSCGGPMAGLSAKFRRYKFRKFSLGSNVFAAPGTAVITVTPTLNMRRGFLVIDDPAGVATRINNITVNGDTINLGMDPLGLPATPLRCQIAGYRDGDFGFILGRINSGTAISVSLTASGAGTVGIFFVGEVQGDSAAISLAACDDGEG